MCANTILYIKSLILNSSSNSCQIDNELAEKREEFKRRMEACAERQIEIQKNQQKVQMEVLFNDKILTYLPVVDAWSSCKVRKIYQRERSKAAQGHTKVSKWGEAQRAKRSRTRTSVGAVESSQSKVRPCPILKPWSNTGQSRTCTALFYDISAFIKLLKILKEKYTVYDKYVHPIFREEMVCACVVRWVTPLYYIEVVLPCHYAVKSEEFFINELPLIK